MIYNSVQSFSEHLRVTAVRSITNLFMTPSLTFNLQFPISYVTITKQILTPWPLVCNNAGTLWCALLQEKGNRFLTPLELNLHQPMTVQAEKQQKWKTSLWRQSSQYCKAINPLQKQENLGRPTCLEVVLEQQHEQGHRKRKPEQTNQIQYFMFWPSFNPVTCQLWAALFLKDCFTQENF